MKTTTLIALLAVSFAPSAWANPVTVNTNRTSFEYDLLDRLTRE